MQEPEPRRGFSARKRTHPAVRSLISRTGKEKAGQSLIARPDHREERLLDLDCGAAGLTVSFRSDLAAQDFADICHDRFIHRDAGVKPGTGLEEHIVGIATGGAEVVGHHRVGGVRIKGLIVDREF